MNAALSVLDMLHMRDYVVLATAAISTTFKHGRQSNDPNMQNS